MKFWVRKALAVSAFMPFSALGQSLTPTLSRPGFDRGPASSREAAGQLRIESMQYLTTVDQAPELNQFQFLSGRFAFVDRLAGSSRWGYRADFAAGTYFRPNQDEFAVNELAIDLKSSERTRISVGRKKALWSVMDEAWNLGLWQPRLALDTLRPESQGLTGIFFEGENDKIGWTLFATPVFVPTMGPDIREEDGRLVPDNRWYRQPSSTQIFNQRLNQVTYGLDVPELGKLVSNPGYGSMLRWGDRLEEGPWAIGALGYKPVNDLMLRRLIVRHSSKPVFDVKVAPDVAYHQIASLDLGYTFPLLRVSASYLEDRPQEKRPEGDWALQRLEAMKAYSFQGQLNLESLFTRPLKIQFGYLRISGALITDIDSAGRVEDFTLFKDRMRFTNTLFAGLDGELARISSKPLEMKLKYLYDQDQRGSIVRTEFLFYPKRDLALLMGADMIGVQDETVKADGFLNQYRANDRYYGGMAYGF